MMKPMRTLGPTFHQPLALAAPLGPPPAAADRNRQSGRQPIIHYRCSSSLFTVLSVDNRFAAPSIHASLDVFTEAWTSQWMEEWVMSR